MDFKRKLGFLPTPVAVASTRRRRGSSQIGGKGAAPSGTV
jgi:hypothetical protein